MALNYFCEIKSTNLMTNLKQQQQKQTSYNISGSIIFILFSVLEASTLPLPYSPRGFTIFYPKSVIRINKLVLEWIGNSEGAHWPSAYSVMLSHCQSSRWPQKMDFHSHFTEGYTEARKVKSELASDFHFLSPHPHPCGCDSKASLHPFFPITPSLSRKLLEIICFFTQ